MSLEIRTVALNVAAAIHKETDKVVEAAKAFASFLTGDGTAVEAPKKPRGRPAAGETNGVATAPTPEQLASAVSAAASAAVTAVVQPSAVQQPVTATPSNVEKPVVTQPTLQQVADAIIAVANSIEPGKGRDAAVAILTKYGVKKVPELKPENFVAVLADVAALSAPSASAGLV